MRKWAWFYAFLPANLIFGATEFMFVRFAKPRLDIEISPDMLDNLLLGYVVIFAALYAGLTVWAYGQTSNKIFRRGNACNLAVSLLINHFVLARIWQDLHWDYHVYPLDSAQYLIFLWLVLLVWQCVVRLVVWFIKLVYDGV